MSDNLPKPVTPDEVLAKSTLKPWMIDDVNKQLLNPPWTTSEWQVGRRVVYTLTTQPLEALIQYYATAGWTVCYDRVRDALIFRRAETGIVPR